MITALIPEDKNFQYEECKKLYDSYRDLIEDDSFEEVIKRTDFYAFHITSTMELIGCSYFYRINGKLYINGFANRHHHLLNTECLKECSKWYDEDVYARTKHKTAILCLLRSGYKPVKKNLYVYRR